MYRKHTRGGRSIGGTAVPPVAESVPEMPDPDEIESPGVWASDKKKNKGKYRKENTEVDE